MKIIILGAPGCGKGTQAKLLEKKYNIKHLSAGDLIREEISRETKFGKEIESYVSKGKLAPDRIVIEIMKSLLAKHSNFILDGFPRNLNQAKALDEFSGIDLVINIEIGESIVIKRLSKRRTCTKCNAVFHLETKPPKQSNVCDFCNSALVRRSDDKEEVIKERLKVYKKETTPLTEYYRNKGILRVINGSGSIEDVFRDLENKLVKEKRILQLKAH